MEKCKNMTISKDEIKDYILDMRSRRCSFKDAVIRILKENGITQAPIPVIEIAKSFGFELYTVTFKDNQIAGVMADSSKNVKPFNCKRVIAINANDYATRKNFTIAHEIAHFVLHCNQKENFYERYKHDLDRGQRGDIENEANRFAAELLMPEHLVLEFLDNTPTQNEYELLERMAYKFIVSKKAAKRRLEEVGYYEKMKECKA